MHGRNLSQAKFHKVINFRVIFWRFSKCFPLTHWSLRRHQQGFKSYFNTANDITSLCCTSYSPGNQVDGLPGALHNEWVRAVFQVWYFSRLFSASIETCRIRIYDFRMKISKDIGDKPVTFGRILGNFLTFKKWFQNEATCIQMALIWSCSYILMRMMLYESSGRKPGWRLPPAPVSLEMIVYGSNLSHQK